VDAIEPTEYEGQWKVLKGEDEIGVGGFSIEVAIKNAIHSSNSKD
jgi:hypothetical protein